MKKPTVISLFTGAGGLDLGFHAAGLHTAVAVEMDGDACATLRQNKSTTKNGYRWEVIEKKVEDVSSQTLLRAGNLKKGEADVLIGGPPCQPFSKSGYWSSGDSKRLSDPRANTLAEYMRVLQDTKPRAFVLENVSGLAYTGKEEGLQFLFKQIARINREEETKYVVTPQVVNAASYGVPQGRERIILVGSRVGKFVFPDARFFPLEEVEDEGSEHFGKMPFRNAWDALGDLPEPTGDEAEEARVRGRWADLLPSIPEGMNYLHHTDRGEGLPLFGWRRRYWSFLLKLAKNRPSWTLTAQPGPAIGPFHWKSRRLVRAELMRLQTFPEGYEVTGSLADVQRQLGNAVPSLLGEVLALEIRRQLLGHRVTSKNPTLLPPQRSPVPRAENVRAVADKYAKLAGEHEAHPGTGLGYGAARRSAA